MSQFRAVVSWMHQNTVKRLDKVVAANQSTYRSRSHFIDVAVTTMLDKAEKSHGEKTKVAAGS